MPSILDEKLKELEDTIGELMLLAASKLYDKTELQTEIFKRLKDAKIALQSVDKSLDKSVLITGVEFETTSIQAKINQEIQIQGEEDSLRRTIPILIFLYILGIIVLIAFGGNIWEGNTEVPIIGIPLSVLTWSAIGSLAAILYRFYKRELGRMQQEFRWLVARPIIGIIMGSLAYLAIVSGLILLSTSNSISESQQTIRPQVIWVISFLGGFSDRFFESVIELVVGRFSNDNDADSDKES